MVLFYAPWCVNSKAFGPKYEEAARMLREVGVEIYKVDAHKNKALYQKFDITGYPTAKMVKGGKEIEDYRQSQDPTELADYVYRHARPNVQSLANIEEVESWLDAAGPETSILFVANDHNATEEVIKGFHDCAQKSHGLFRFGLCQNPDCVVKYGKDTPPAYGEQNPDFGNSGISLHLARRLMLAKHEPPGWRHFQEPLDLVAYDSSYVKNWIEGVIPLAGEMRPHMYDRYAMANKPIFMLYADLDWKSNSKQAIYYLNRLRQAAKEHQGLVLFALADKKYFSHDLEQFGLNSTTPGELWTIRSHDTKKYASKPGTPFTKSAILDFVKKFQAGTLKNFLKSAPAPDINNLQAGSVYELVRENMDQWLADWTRGVMILFYAPWCPHSAKLLETYAEVAKQLDRYVHKVLITKFDATANDVPAQYSVKEYPTIYWIPPTKEGRHMPVKYMENRTLIGFMDFFTNASLSNAIPEFKWMQPAMTPLTPENYTATTKDASKHVIVVFQTPIRGFHSSFDVLENYAHHMRNRHDVLMAQVDPDLYEGLAKAEQIDTFPTMKLYSKDNKEGVRYHGAMIEADIDRWLAERIGVVELMGRPPRDKNEEEMEASTSDQAGSNKDIGVHGHSIDEKDFQSGNFQATFGSDGKKVEKSSSSPSSPPGPARSPPSRKNRYQSSTASRDFGPSANSADEMERSLHQALHTEL